jgi:hypothetical protein
LTAVLAAVAAALPPAAAWPRVLDAGPTEAQRASSAPVLELPFVARADEEVVGARVRIRLAAPRPPGSPVEALEVLVNDERVAVLPSGEAEAGAERELEVSGDLLGARSLLTVRLLDGAGREVARPGAWHAVSSIRLVLETTPASLPNDLALLPLPFVDRGFDAAATIPIVLGTAPDAGRVRLAALVASWIAVDVPIPIDFTAQAGVLPDGRAVVLLEGAEDAERLGLAPPTGPTVRLVDHPAHAGGNVKLLVIGGRDGDELRRAVESLVARAERLVGEEIRLAPARPEPPAAPYSAPRWVGSSRPVPFSEYPAGGTPAHEGSTSATLPVRFRVAPDLAIWPAEFVVLDLGWSVRLPRDVSPPRLDVDLNGYFLTTLPPASGPGEETRRVRLRIPRQHMRGFNELRVHVHYPEGAGPGREQPRVAIAGDSMLHLAGLSHYTTMPDVALFAYDGFPFTRVPDLGETAIVVPERPTVDDVAAVLSIAAQLAQVTGRIGTRATVLAADAATDEALRGKDVLVVGAADRQGLVARWRALLPLVLDADGARLQRSPRSRPWLDLAGGLGPLLDRRRAEAVLASEGGVAAVMGIESPVTPGRIAIFVTAPGRTPGFRNLLGYAESRTSGSHDLLVAAGDRRWMFRVGPTFGRGELDAWTRLRWFLARHWTLLLPVAAVGVVLLARQLHHGLAGVMRERLAEGGSA